METTQNTEVTNGTELSEAARLREELRREHEMHLRALADFDNYRRRVERERASAANRGKREIILSLLEILDGFDRALKHMGDAPSSVSAGFEAIYRKLLSLLEAQGVHAFKTIGESFNPAVHEAIGSIDSNEYPPGTVADEVQRGYQWGDDLLRPARVLVSQ
jgi:molecular chaperone GrpE